MRSFHNRNKRHNYTKWDKNECKRLVYAPRTYTRYCQMKLQYIAILVPCLVIVFALYFIFEKDKYDNIIVTEDTLRTIQNLIEKNPIFIASKSYCPYGRQAYITLTHNCRVPKDKIKIIYLDELKYGAELQKGLYQINGHSTVPQIYINHKFIGGNDNLQELKNKGQLNNLIKDALT